MGPTEQPATMTNTTPATDLKPANSTKTGTKHSIITGNSGFAKPGLVKESIRVVVIHGDPNKEDPILPNGRWDEDDFETLNILKQSLASLGPKWTFEFLSNHDTMLEDLKSRKEKGEIDLVLQFCDSGWMNNSRAEAQIVGFIEMLDLPYTGASSRTISLSYDKYAILEIAESLGVPIPKTFYVENDEELETLKTQIAYPAFVKPSSTDGSFGITEKSVCKTPQDIDAAMKMIREDFGVDCPILVQEFLDGRDINVGVLGYCEKNGEPRALPITEEDYSALPENLPKILGFESKWDPESPYWNIKTRPTTLTKEVQDKVIEWSLRLFKRLDIHDYCRFDWRLDSQGHPRLIEVNPNCGWCWDGHLTKTANLCDIDYSSVLKVIMESALYRREKELALRARPKKLVNVASHKALPVVPASAVTTNSGTTDAQK